MTADVLTIEIDGRAVPANPGSTIIEAADAAGIEIPRFCYHKKLSVAANCRMCMVEVEKTAKPVPACSTPVVEGMKISTRSEEARDAQQGTMEFLLINHPLDCPICDQGGECELQDVALTFGSDVSRFCEGKREVPDPNLGPLIATDMNRCIHCTRCVRFGQEIAGIRELGATGRGEFMKIGTYVEKTVDSEVSGNVIDICPVGALTAKPSRYKYRPWELVEHNAISLLDGLGSNINLHLNRKKVTRVVPAENESVNECWISDRDRYFYEGLYTRDRAVRPQIKQRGKWQNISWEQALSEVIERTLPLVADTGVLASASATTEELYLLQKLARALDIHSIDHRLRQQDFRDDASSPIAPLLGCEPNALTHYRQITLIGANVRKTIPVMALRMRAAAKAGTRFASVAVRDYDLPLNYSVQLQVSPLQMVAELASVARLVASDKGAAVPSWLDKLPASDSSDAQALASELLAQGDGVLLLLGPEVLNHPDASVLKAISGLIASLLDARVGYLAEGGNAVAASLLGVLPQRRENGQPILQPGLNAGEMFKAGRKGFWLFNFEPEADVADPQLALQALQNAQFVVTFATHTTASMYEYSDLILPIAALSEKAGSSINLAGQQQRFYAATQPPDEAKSAWAVLRMLGVTAGLDHFAYPNLAAVQQEIDAKIDIPQSVTTADTLADTTIQPPPSVSGWLRINEVSLYGNDPVVRRSKSLQATADARDLLRISVTDAQQLGVVNGDLLRLSQGATAVELPVQIDASLANGVVVTPAGMRKLARLSAPYATVNLEKVSA